MKIRKRNGERGQAMIESALTIVMFLTLLIGVLDFGQVLYFQQSLVERARAAARYGAIRPTQTTQIQNVAVYNSPAPTGGAKPMVPGLTTAMVNVQAADLTNPAGRITVTISNYPMNFYTPFLARSFKNARVTVTLPSEAP